MKKIRFSLSSPSQEEATGIDPYEPITGEDEGFPGWVGAVIVILMGLATVAHVLHLGKR